MKKILYSSIALTIVVAAIIYGFGVEREDTSPGRTSETPIETPIDIPGGTPHPIANPSTGSAAAAPSGGEVPSQSPSSGPSSGPSSIPSPTERVIDFAPKLETYRSEVDRDPHGTPPSLQRFARLMAAKMEAGMRIESAARALVPELQDCAMNSEVESPRAVCVMNGRRLARKFPDLQPSWVEFEASLPPLLQKRVEQLNSL